MFANFGERDLQQRQQQQQQNVQYRRHNNNNKNQRRAQPEHQKAATLSRFDAAATYEKQVQEEYARLRQAYEEQQRAKQPQLSAEQIQQLAASKSPADNIIALLGQVKETLEHIDESSTARGAERERHCLKREKIMVNRLSALKQKAGIKDDDEGDKNDEKEQSKAANAAAKLDRAIKKRKGDRLLQQFRSTKYLAERLQAGFSGDMESYALASNVRDAGHTAFVEHQSRYNSYTHVLESMVSIMELSIK